VRRVVALAAPDKLASVPDQQADHAAPPPMLMPKLTPPSTNVPTGPSTDIGTTRALVKEADDACKLVQQKATASAPLALQRFAKYCVSYVQRAKATLGDGSQVNQAQVDLIARGSKGMTATAQRLMQPSRKD